MITEPSPGQPGQPDCVNKLSSCSISFNSSVKI